jgi:hypothetical protein
MDAMVIGPAEDQCTMAEAKLPLTLASRWPIPQTHLGPRQLIKARRFVG